MHLVIRTIGVAFKAPLRAEMSGFVDDAGNLGSRRGGPLEKELKLARALS
jgi:hypothetical protein